MVTILNFGALIFNIFTVRRVLFFRFPILKIDQPNLSALIPNSVLEIAPCMVPLLEQEVIYLLVIIQTKTKKVQQILERPIKVKKKLKNKKNYKLKKLKKKVVITNLNLLKPKTFCADPNILKFRK